MSAVNKVSGNKIIRKKVLRKIYPKKKNPKKVINLVNMRSSIRRFHKKDFITHLYFDVLILIAPWLQTSFVPLPFLP